MNGDSTAAVVAPSAAQTPWLERVPSWALATAGLVGLLLTGARWNVPALAWVSPVPLLLLARRLDSTRRWLGFAGFLSVALTLQVAKIVTEPVPAPMALMFSLPAAASLVLIFALTEWVRRRAGEHAGVAVLATASALGDLAGYRFTELGGWMTAATTQASSVLVMQLASVVGLWGIGLLMAWVAAVVASLAAEGVRGAMGLHALALGVTLLAALGWATTRLEQAQGGTLTVAAVTTDVGVGARGLPTDAELARNVDELFARSEEAATRGAKLIAWPEAATVVRPDGEAALVERARAFSTRRGVDLALAYAVLVSEGPLLLDNKVSFVTSEGAIAQTYRKHHPVPGEPSMKGEEPLELVERPYGKVGLAICYDYDFPALARRHAELGAQVVLVPSSDWPGIDPIHTELARARAIEGGFSVVRPVRWATSAAFDGLGRVRGLLPGRELDKVMVATVPLEQLSTVYTRVGDAPALVLVAPLLGAVGLAVMRRRRLTARR